MWVSSYVLDMSCNWGIVWSSCTLGEPSGAGVSRQSWDPLGKPDNLDAEKDIELFHCSIVPNCSFVFSWWSQNSFSALRNPHYLEEVHLSHNVLTEIGAVWSSSSAFSDTSDPSGSKSMSPRSPSFAPLSAIVCAAMSRYGCGRFVQRHGAASGTPRKHHKSLGFHQP